MSEKLLMLATYIVVSQQVEPERFGLLVLVFLIIELLGYVASFGVSENIIRHPTAEPRFLASCFRFCSYISAAVVAVMLLLVTPLAWNFSGMELAELVALMALQPALNCFTGFYLGLLQRDMRFREIALRTTIIAFLSGGTGIALALSGFGIYSLIAGRYVYSIADLILLKRFTGYRNRASADPQEIVGIWRFGWKLSLSQLFNFSSTKIFEIFTVSFLGPASLALLDVGRKFIVTVQRVVLTPLSSVAMAYVARSEEPAAAFVRFTRFTSLLLIPVTAALGALADPLILLFFGAEYARSGYVLELFALASCIQVALWFAPSILIKQGRSDSVLTLQTINLVVVSLVCVAAWLISEGLESFLALAVAGIFISGFVRLAICTAIARLPWAAIVGLLLTVAAVYGYFYLASQWLFSLWASDADGPVWMFAKMAAASLAAALPYLPLLIWMALREKRLLQSLSRRNQPS
mgnify:CR=1 FL=1